ncbi:4-hydroxyphenylacetaldehyde oxime monooxygenase-like isoform X2 [Miscanthus floridulus]|uniref:4-hydroxyphenylacetaldehyde oxime monooxygenase-like isoform X2 n=1 Tax=Miscanthus floridulus TaxID=154761 RepID=UPI0034581686
MAVQVIVQGSSSSSPQQWHLTVVMTVLVPLLLLLLARKRRAGKSWSSKKGRCVLLHLPPGPPRLPILGNLHQLGALPHQSLRELARRHGPVMLLRLGSVPTLVVSSAEVAREVMKARDADCCSRPDTPGARRLSYDHKDVAFSPYGDYWREMRKLFVVEFLSARRVRAADYAREAEVDKLIGRLSSASGKAVQLEDHIFGFMDGVIGTVAFGNIYGTEQFAHKKHFHDVLDEAMSAKAGFSTEDYYPNAAGRLVDRLTGAAARRERVFRDLDAFFDTIIDQHLVDPSSRATTPGGHGPDLIDVFVDLMEERRQRQAGSHHFTRDHIKGLLSRGHELGDHGVGDGGADPEAGDAEEGAGGGPDRGGRRRQGEGAPRRRVQAQVPEGGGEGDAAAAPGGAAAAAEGDAAAREHLRVRRAGKDEGAGERVGHRQGPPQLGGQARGVRPGQVRRGRGLQRHALRARPLRRRPPDVPWHGHGRGHHGVHARKPALLLRLGAPGGGAGGGREHGRGRRAHRPQENAAPACPDKIQVCVTHCL